MYLALLGRKVKYDSTYFKNYWCNNCCIIINGIYLSYSWSNIFTLRYYYCNIYVILQTFSMDI